MNIVVLDIQRLEYLGASLEGALSSNDKLTGIIFMGHGTNQKYFLSPKSVYTGDQMARVLTQSLTKISLASELTIYLNSCNVANDSDGKSFLGTFADSISMNQFAFDYIQLVGHEYAANGFFSHKKWNYFDTLMMRITPQEVRNILKNPPFAGIVVGHIGLIAGMLLLNANLYADWPAETLLNGLSYIAWTTVATLTASLMATKPMAKVVKRITILSSGDIIESKESVHETLNGLQKSCAKLLSKNVMSTP